MVAYQVVLPAAAVQTSEVAEVLDLDLLTLFLVVAAMKTIGWQSHWYLVDQEVLIPVVEVEPHILAEAFRNYFHPIDLEAAGLPFPVVEVAYSTHHLEVVFH